MTMLAAEDLQCLMQDEENEDTDKGAAVKPKQPKYASGVFDYEDDFIDDSDLIDLVKASKKKAKVDGFVVIRVSPPPPPPTQRRKILFPCLEAVSVPARLSPR